jgi:phosphatidylserine/phosphatidylglycerophosphate/cardiolipin synthase-like enzyme
VIVVDERTVITGSYNFTGSAEKENDQNLVIVDDVALARAYLDEFTRVYAQAQVPTRGQITIMVGKFISIEIFQLRYFSFLYRGITKLYTW